MNNIIISFLQWLPHKPQFQWIFLVYRWVFALYFLAWLFAAGLSSENAGPFFFIYLTNWGLIVWTLYLLVAALTVTVKFFHVHFCGRKHYQGKDLTSRYDEFVFEKPEGFCGASNCSNGFHFLQWLFFTVGAEVAFGILVLYWGLLYRGGPVSGVNANTHLVNGLIAVLDVLIVGHPVRILHVIYIVGFGITYLAFAGLYFAANGVNPYNTEQYIYAVIDYGSSPVSASLTSLGVVLIFLPIVHMLFYCLYLIRYSIIYCIYAKHHRKEAENLQTENPGLPSTELKDIA